MEKAKRTEINNRQPQIKNELEETNCIQNCIQRPFFGGLK